MEDARGIGGGESNENGSSGGAALEAMPTLPVARRDADAALTPSPAQLEATGMPGSMVAVDDWRQAGLALVEAAPDDAARLAVRDAAVAVRDVAESVGDVERQCAAAVVEQAVKRAIGQAHGAGQSRDKGGRPPKDAPTENLATGRQVSGVVPPRTVRDYRADAEAVSDQGFEAVADASEAAGAPLDRAMVRRAGELERAGEDPAGAAREPKTRPTVRDADRAPSRVMVEAAQVFFGGRLTIDGPIVIGNGRDAPLDLDIYTAHGICARWEPDPCPRYWRPHIWLCPPLRLQEQYAHLLRKAFDGPRDRRPQSAVMAVGGETHKTWMRDLLSTVHAVHWLDVDSAPWRMLLFWGFPLDRVLDAWAQQGLRAWVSVSDRGGEWPRD